VALVIAFSWARDHGPSSRPHQHPVL
jgi:hypothetical protein